MRGCLPVYFIWVLRYASLSKAKAWKYMNLTSRWLKRSSAVAERPRDVSCMSVVSFNSTIPRGQSSIISYFGFRFCSVLLGVVVHAAGAAINKFQCVAVCAVNGYAKCDLLLHRRPCIVDRTPPVIDPKARYWSRIAIFAYPTYIRWFDAPVRGLRQNIAIAFGVEKAEGVATRRWKNEDKFIRFDWIHERDGRTDGHHMKKRHRPRICIASRGINQKEMVLAAYYNKLNFTLCDNTNKH